MTRARDIANQGAGTYGSITADDLTVDTTTLVVDESNNRVGVATANPDSKLTVANVTAWHDGIQIRRDSPSDQYLALGYDVGAAFIAPVDETPGSTGDGQTLLFGVSSDGSTFTETARFQYNVGLLVGTTNNSPAESSTEDGVRLGFNGGSQFSHSGDVILLNRLNSDGGMLQFRQAGTQEGEVRVSGTTVSYNGGHLSRWSRLADDSKDTSIVKGTVMTNLDAMIEWSHDAVEEVLDDEGNVVTEAKEAYTEENEQLNKMAVSSVEGDPNVAGVFVDWDDKDDFNDMNVAMTGDMVIRIAQGTTVARGDLLMSAGDGTAKPQDDDIVRSKTIAKVTSTHVSHTYDDGSYLVPCVLMAC